jgi:putative lipoic acid-binding regulatory protein
MANDNKPTSHTLQNLEIEYPCIWQYKVIGEDTTILKEVIVAACAPLQPKIHYSQSSSRGRYHSFNVEVEVSCEEIRLQIFATLRDSQAVKMIL